MKKKLFLTFSFMILTAMSFAQSACDDKSEDSVYKCGPACDTDNPTDLKQGHEACDYHMNPSFSHPARIDVTCPWDYYLSASFIYWHAKEEGLDFVVQSGTVTGVVNNVNIIDLDFDYHPGFKVAAGMNFEYDNWGMELEYTRLNFDNSRSVENPDKALEVYEFISLWSANAINGMSDLYYSKSKWDLDYNIFDLSLFRSFYSGRKFTLKPFVGLRAGWIDQKTNQHDRTFDTPDDINIYTTVKTDSWLIGPRVGIDGAWHLGAGFRFIGNSAASLFYQKFKTNYKSEKPIQDGVTVLQSIAMNKKEGFLIPNMEMVLGFAWGDYFSDNSWHLDISAEYEFHYFWKQNAMRMLSNYANLYSRNTKNALMLHGLTINVKIDF